MQKKIKSALVSVFHKEGLDVIVKCLNDHGVKIYSTGGRGVLKIRKIIHYIL